jgi:hypothetical protein
MQLVQVSGALHRPMRTLSLAVNRFRKVPLDEGRFKALILAAPEHAVLRNGPVLTGRGQAAARKAAEQRHNGVERSFNTLHGNNSSGISSDSAGTRSHQQQRKRNTPSSSGGGATPLSLADSSSSSGKRNAAAGTGSGSSGVFQTNPSPPSAILPCALLCFSFSPPLLLFLIIPFASWNLLPQGLPTSARLPVPTTSHQQPQQPQLARRRQQQQAKPAPPTSHASARLQLVPQVCSLFALLLVPLCFSSLSILPSHSALLLFIRCLQGLPTSAIATHQQQPQLARTRQQQQATPAPPQVRKL